MRWFDDTQCVTAVFGIRTVDPPYWAIAVAIADSAAADAATTGAGAACVAAAIAAAAGSAKTLPYLR